MRFLLPVKVGDILNAEANFSNVDGRKYYVDVKVQRDKDLVFTGKFICFTPETQVLSGE